MASQAEVEELMARTVREKVDIYRQMKEQLARDVEKHRREGRDRLASIISESLRDQPRIR